MEYKPGDKIRYNPYRTTQMERTVIVHLRDPNIKHDKPGFVGEVWSGPEDGLMVWGLDEQIVSVNA